MVKNLLVIIIIFKVKCNYLTIEDMPSIYDYYLNEFARGI
jgi:hypothetical protein